jgi:pSer/pThr/pTyr-binding forkhead associated (FHA) protein
MSKIKVVRLVADSEKLRKQDALKNREIDEFPFFIGRRRDSAAIDVFQKNQLAIFDERPFSISRNHCAIEYLDKEIFVRDRGSHTGTIVNGVRINGSGTSIDRVKLEQSENTLILGGPESEVRFKILLSR